MAAKVKQDGLTDECFLKTFRAAMAAGGVSRPHDFFFLL